MGSPFLNSCAQMYEHIRIGIPLPEDFSLQEYDVVMMIHGQINKLEREKEAEMERQRRTRGRF